MNLVKRFMRVGSYKTFKIYKMGICNEIRAYKRIMHGDGDSVVLEKVWLQPRNLNCGDSFENFLRRVYQKSRSKEQLHSLGKVILQGRRQRKGKKMSFNTQAEIFLVAFHALCNTLFLKEKGLLAKSGKLDACMVEPNSLS